MAQSQARAAAHVTAQAALGGEHPGATSSIRHEYHNYAGPSRERSTSAGPSRNRAVSAGPSKPRVVSTQSSKFSLQGGLDEGSYFVPPTPLNSYTQMTRPASGIGSVSSRAPPGSDPSLYVDSATRPFPLLTPENGSVRSTILGEETSVNNTSHVSSAQSTAGKGSVRNARLGIMKRLGMGKGSEKDAAEGKVTVNPLEKVKSRGTEEHAAEGKVTAKRLDKGKGKAIEEDVDQSAEIGPRVDKGKGIAANSLPGAPITNDPIEGDYFNSGRTMPQKGSVRNARMNLHLRRLSTFSETSFGAGNRDPVQYPVLPDIDAPAPPPSSRSSGDSALRSAQTFAQTSAYTQYSAEEPPTQFSAPRKSSAYSAQRSRNSSALRPYAIEESPPQLSAQQEETVDEETFNPADVPAPLFLGSQQYFHQHHRRPSLAARSPYTPPSSIMSPPIPYASKPVMTPVVLQQSFSETLSSTQAEVPELSRGEDSTPEQSELQTETRDNVTDVTESLPGIYLFSNPLNLH